MDGNGMYIDTTIKGGGEAYAPLGRIDKFELVRELGEGGFGAVYLARDTVAGIDVAIKGLPPEVKHNESELEPIRANFALVSRLRHPNIVGLRDLHRAERASYASKEVEEKLRVFERDTMVVMDYAPGVTLAKWRRQFSDDRVPLDKAIEIARQIASALDAAHAQKVLHRDVKPENVMVETREDGSFVARVLDFGLAAEIRSSMGRVSRKILDTSGTRPYMAPEQWLGEEQNAVTDQYALAVLFYELVAGKTPFSSVFDCGDTAVMRLAVTTDAPKIPASLPKAVRRALDTALAKTPDERFTTCGDFVVALEGKRVPRRGAETQRKSGAVKMLGLLALLAVLAVGVWRFAGRETTSVAPSPASAELTPPVASGDISNVPPSSDPSPAKPVVVESPADDGAESAQKRAADNTEAGKLKNKANAQIGPSDGEHRWFTLPGGVKMEMVYVAASRRPFKMGSENGNENKKPVHDVRFTKGFWIGKYPITQSQWKELVSANGVSFDNGNPSPWFSSTGRGRDCVTGLDTSDFPMESISWNDCDALVKALNRNARDGRTYSIPTEVQWEFAARGGNKSQGYVYSGGNDMDGLGWYCENSGNRRLSDSDWKVENLNSDKRRTHSVREKDIGNELGIVGMSGNVWEWCKDLYDKDYYANSPTDDPCNTASGAGRVLRGGSWYDDARDCRSAVRYKLGPGIRLEIIGFRLCCSAGPRD